MVKAPLGSMRWSGEWVISFTPPACHYLSRCVVIKIAHLTTGRLLEFLQVGMGLSVNQKECIKCPMGLTSNQTTIPFALPQKNGRSCSRRSSREQLQRRIPQTSLVAGRTFLVPRWSRSLWPRHVEEGIPGKGGTPRCRGGRSYRPTCSLDQTPPPRYYECLQDSGLPNDTLYRTIQPQPRRGFPHHRLHRRSFCLVIHQQ